MKRKIILLAPVLSLLTLSSCTLVNTNQSAAKDEAPAERRTDDRQIDEGQTDDTGELEWNRPARISLTCTPVEPCMAQQANGCIDSVRIEEIYEGSFEMNFELSGLEPNEDGVTTGSKRLRSGEIASSEVTNEMITAYWDNEDTFFRLRTDDGGRTYSGDPIATDYTLGLFYEEDFSYGIACADNIGDLQRPAALDDCEWTAYQALANHEAANDPFIRPAEIALEHMVEIQAPRGSKVYILDTGYMGGWAQSSVELNEACTEVLAIERLDND